MNTLLLAEDDAALRETLAEEFSERGYVVTAVASVEELDALGVPPFRFAVVDLRLGNDDGLSVVERIRSRSPESRVVVLTGYGTIPSTVKAMRLGAVDYLSKPVSFPVLEAALLGRSQGVEEDTSATTLARQEREYIEYVLARCEGNITHAARELGIHRQSLQRKLRKFVPLR